MGEERDARDRGGDTRNEIRVDCERVNPEGWKRAASAVLIATTRPVEK